MEAMEAKIAHMKAYLFLLGFLGIAEEASSMWYPILRIE